jgi:hypothetical protein
MKLVLVLLGLGVVAAIAYLMGTESGRGRRDDLVSRARKTSGGDVSEIDLREQASELAESGADLADDAASRIGTSN